MPSTDTITRQCHAFNDLALILDKCSEDYGYSGCMSCNVYGECLSWYNRLNRRLESGSRLKAHEYMDYARQFDTIKRQRNLPRREAVNAASRIYPVLR